MSDLTIAKKMAPGRGESLRSAGDIFRDLLSGTLYNRALPDELFRFFFFVLSTLSASATPPIVRHYKSSSEAFEGPDRTITWRAWKEASGGEFRVRTGDRYLGGQVWEHYLGFELYRASVKPIKLSMIRLGSEEVREEVVIRQGLRYAIVEVTNGKMTAHKGVWNWTAQEVR